MDLLNGVCGACVKRDRNLPEGEPFLFNEENNMDPGLGELFLWFLALFRGLSGSPLCLHAKFEILVWNPYDTNTVTSFL